MKTKTKTIVVAALILIALGIGLIFSDLTWEGILCSVVAVAIISRMLFIPRSQTFKHQDEDKGMYYYLCGEAFIGEIANADTLIVYWEGHPIVSATTEELRQEIADAKDPAYPPSYRQLWNEALGLMEAFQRGELA